MGDVLSDGMSDVDYVTLITRNTAAPGTGGFFQNGLSVDAALALGGAIGNVSPTHPPKPPHNSRQFLSE